MALTSAITVQTNRLMVDNLAASTITMKITATLTGDGTDNPDPAKDQYTFTVQPSSMGNMAAAKGNSLTASIQSTSNPNTFTATTTVIGTKYGRCQVAGNKEGATTIWKAPAIGVTVEALLEKAVVTRDFDPALKVNQAPGTPDSSPDKTTYMEILLTDLLGNPIPESPVTFLVNNVRTNSAVQTAVFYVTNKTASTPIPINPNIPVSNATITQNTDTSGKARLYVGTNSFSGYVNIQISTNSSIDQGGFVYIYEDLPGTESPAPTARIGPDVSRETRLDFPVTVENSYITDDEFIGLFLNGIYQNQILGTQFDNSLVVTAQASISDLIPGTPEQRSPNSMVGHRTAKGDLIRSKEYIFYIDSALPDPRPRNPILGPMVDPNGGVINLGSIHAPNGDPEDYITSINVSRDVPLLLNDEKYKAQAGDRLCLVALFQGDYETYDNFKKNIYYYDKILAEADLSSTNVNITIPFDDISGYGTPKLNYLISKYAMYYNYIPKDSTQIIASSSIVQGALSTRII